MIDRRLNTRLGNYRLLRLIGKGGFANVYLAEHITLGTYAAIKVLHTKYAQSEEKIASFYAESRLIASMESHHIVRVLDCDNEGNTFFFVMDYASNGTLRQFTSKDSLLPLDTLIKYIKQTASAIQFMHHRGYIHRDVKPENVLLDRYGNIRLCDFGIALPIPASPPERTKDIGGTVGYMSPEQLRRMPCPASDQYSLAIVTYELLVGDCPFHGTSTQIADQHKHVRPPSLRAMAPNIPPAIERVVLKALSKDPRMRYPNTQAYAITLEQAYAEGSFPLRHHTVPVHPQPLPTRPLSVDVQSRPVALRRLSVDKRSEPLPAIQSSGTVHSEPLPLRRQKRIGSPAHEAYRPAKTMKQPALQWKERPAQAQFLDAFEFAGRVAADIFISIVLGGVMFVGGFGYDLALSLSATILLVLLGISLLDGWAAILLPVIMLGVSALTGVFFHSLTVFWISIVFMCILMIVSICISWLRRRRNGS